MARLDAFLAAADSYLPEESPLERYYADPAAFAIDLIDWSGTDGLAPYQVDILDALKTSRRVSVRGPHGLGKSALSAVCVLWFALTRDAAGVDWKCCTTAGAWRQLENVLWPEITKWSRCLRWEQIGRKPFNHGELLTMRLQLRHGRAFAVASDTPSLIEGVHGDSILYVFDESKSISVDTFNSAEGAFSANNPGGLPEAFAMCTSTPGEPSGHFHAIHTKKPGLEQWWTRHVTLTECMAAKRVAPSWADDLKRQWGEDSALYANRVLGEFHTADQDGVIKLESVEAAIDRYLEAKREGTLPTEVTHVGVDVARSGEDKTCLALRAGDAIIELRYSSHQNLMATTGRVVGVLGAHPTAQAVVDVIGIGSGVVDRLREQKQAVEAFNASAGTKAKDRSGELGFVNVRAAAWWHLRELLEAEDSQIILPPDDALIGDLTTPHWKMTSAGKVQLESKDEIRRRIRRSTDSGDAVVQAFWSEPTVKGPRLVFAGRWDRRPGGEIERDVTDKKSDDDAAFERLLARKRRARDSGLQDWGARPW